MALDRLQSISTIYLSLSSQMYASGAAYQNDVTLVNNALIDTTSLGQRDLASAIVNACGLASLRAYAASLATSGASLSPESKYTASSAHFTDVVNRAKLGEVDANFQLNTAATAFLTASNYWYGGGAGYTSDFYLVQQKRAEVQSLVLPVAPATISSSNGLATAVGLGTSKITATAGGVSGTTTLTISVP